MLRPKPFHQCIMSMREAARLPTTPSRQARGVEPLGSLPVTLRTPITSCRPSPLASHVRYVTRRDIKAENVLKNSKGRWVICDFGSSTARAQVYDTPAEIAMEEDNIRRTTTPAYRSPEVGPPRDAAVFSCPLLYRRMSTSRASS